MGKNKNITTTGNGFHRQTNNHGNGLYNGSVNYIGKMFIPSLAFVLSCPQAKTKKPSLYYNHEAFNVLSRISPSLKDEKALSAYGTSLYTKWKDLIDKKDDLLSIDTLSKNFDMNRGADYFDILKSDRRRYGIRGTILTLQPPIKEKQDKHYLFVMERICINYPNLPMIIRLWDLNRREHEIVELLFKGLCNKEMARVLGLSPNTVKMYLKILMNKLGVGSRAEIIHTLLTIK